MDARVVAAAFFAPAVVWLLWRLQSLTVDHVLRAGMVKLLRYQRTTYNIVSWFGVLLHEVSHAVFLLLGGHGIRKFSVRVDEGHVVPSQMRRGPVGSITFVVAALAPMFVAPAVIFVVTWRLVDRGLIVIADAGAGWQATWPVLRDMAVRLPVRLVDALLGLDLLTWQGALVFALIVFALPSARPSFVPGERGQRDSGDIAVVRSKVRRRPLTFLLVAAVLVASYGLVAWQPRLYWLPWQVAWATSMTAILLAALAGVGWWFVARAGRIQWWAAWVPFAVAVGIQALARMDAGPDVDLWLANAASLAAFGLLAVGLSVAMPRRW